ncbi:hypothetical protein Tco_1477532, partial [Tanacetum coccineum]
FEQLACYCISALFVAQYYSIVAELQLC